MIKTLILIAIILISPVLTAQENELSLAGALKTGLENNYQIRISDQNLQIARNNNSWGNAGMFPLVSAGASQNNIYTDLLNDVSSTNNLTPYLRLNWTLFDGLSVHITKERFEYIQELTEGNVALMVENTIQAIVLAYYNALLQQQNLDVVTELMDLSRDRYDYEQTKKELGSSVSFDVLQAKTNYLTDSSNYLLQKLAYENSIRNLNLILATPSENTYELTEEFAFLAPDYEYDSLKSAMQGNNKTLMNQYINQELLKNDVSLQKSALYPTVSLSSGMEYGIGRRETPLGGVQNTNSLDAYANLSLSYTLSNGGRIQRAIKNAKIQEQIGQLETDELIHTLNNRLFNTYELYKARKELYSVTIENENAARLNMTIAQEKYNLGAINSFNYRDIQLIFLNAALNKLQALYSLIDSHTELMRLTGRIIDEY
ncbi:MAG: TolC family protein [Bacteroidota bacterium]